MSYAISCLLEEEKYLLGRVITFKKWMKSKPSDELTEAYEEYATKLKDVQNAISTLQDIAKDEE